MPLNAVELPALINVSGRGRGRSQVLPSHRNSEPDAFQQTYNVV